MADLIPAPQLDIDDEELLAATMIGRVSGSLDVARIDSQIVTLRNLRDLVASGALSPATCPELTNANPSSPHTVILETLGWSLAQIARRINQLPDQNRIAFANLFGTGVRAATKATTTLTFTSDGQHEATIPEGTQVTIQDGTISFVTSGELVIADDESEGTVAAERTVAGATLLAPNTLTKMSDAIAFVTAVTNDDPIDSGSESETIDAALQRARNFQRRGLRLVSERDVEDFVFEEMLQGVGIVKVFQLVKEGDFETRKVGHTSIVVMTPNGYAVSSEVKEAINAGLHEAVGSQMFYLLDPSYVSFSVTASIKISDIAPQDAIKAAVETNLRNFYAPKKGNLGRKILRSEIISIVEGTPGVDRIASGDEGPILQSPDADIEVAPYQMPQLIAVLLTVVP